MDDAAFRTLVEQLEQTAAQRPHVYRFRVAGLAVLGYSYVFGMLLVLCAVTVALILSGRVLTLKIVIPLLIVISVIVRALWVHVRAPTGLRVTRRDAPALVDLVNRLVRRLQTPRVHVILVIPDVNAAVVQVPRLGIFGWYRNYLLIGLPLLQALSDEEWQAVLAHELGHLSGSHGQFGAWIYRLRTTWMRLVQGLEARNSRIGNFLFSGFLKWYVPYFNAYSFVLARAHEYEADAAAAELVGREAAGRALLRLEIAGHQAEEYWNGLSRNALELPEPPVHAFRDLGSALRAQAPADQAREWLSIAWRSPTSYSDTHPSLADRLQALGWPGGNDAPSPPPPLEGWTAAEAYLGAVTRIEGQLGGTWANEVKQPWQQRHAELVDARSRLTALDARSEDSLSPDDAWQRITLCNTLGEQRRADELAEALFIRAPEHRGVRFYRGQMMLARGDAGGIALIEQVMREDPETILAGCQTLFGYHWSRGEKDEANRYHTMAMDRQALLERAQTERATILPSMEIEPHDFTPEQLAALRQQLEKFAGVRAVFLVRRVVKVLPELPCYVLGVEPAYNRFMGYDARKGVQLRDAIAEGLVTHVPLYVCILDDQFKKLLRVLKRMPGAQVR